MMELPSSNTFPVRHPLYPWPHVSDSDPDLKPYRHLPAPQSPEKHSWLQVFTIHCGSPAPSDEVGLKSNMKCLQADKFHSEQTGSGGRIHKK